MKKQRIRMFLMTLLLVVLGSFTALADYSINHIQLELSTNIRPGNHFDNVDAEEGEYGYWVDEVRVTNPPKDGKSWREDDRPKVKLLLVADSDCYFGNINENSVSFTGINATILSVHKKNNSREVSISLQFPRLRYNGYPYYDGNPNTNANRSGQVFLNTVGPTIPYGTGPWVQDAQGWKYLNPDYSYTTDSWQLIDGKWYFFGADSYMKVGWIIWNGRWYFCGNDGAMLSNVTTADGYRLGADGALIE